MDFVPLEQDKTSLPKAVYPLNNHCLFFYPPLSYLSVAKKYVSSCIFKNTIYFETLLGLTLDKKRMGNNSL
jgi:hypothetical protein